MASSFSASEDSRADFEAGFNDLEGVIHVTLKAARLMDETKITHWMAVADTFVTKTALVRAMAQARSTESIIWLKIFLGQIYHTQLEVPITILKGITKTEASLLEKLLMIDSTQILMLPPNLTKPHLITSNPTWI